MSTPSRAHAEVLAACARIGHAVGHPARLRLLSLLEQAPRTVSVLAETCGESVANTSAHLAVLAGAGLVGRARDGRHMRYALADDAVSALVASMRTVGERVAPAPAREGFAAFHGDDVAPITPAQLRSQVRAGVDLLDVRPEDEFAAGHLPGARSLPLSRLRSDPEALAGDAPVLVYCRGRYCPSAVEGVRRLARAGRHVRRLPFGVAEWKAHGYALSR
jgi:rhodanese-related sulfurtransferase/DNA-binding transcriptional ArsR family regulator